MEFYYSKEKFINKEEIKMKMKEYVDFFVELNDERDECDVLKSRSDEVFLFHLEKYAHEKMFFLKDRNTENLDAILDAAKEIFFSRFEEDFISHDLRTDRFNKDIKPFLQSLEEVKEYLIQRYEQLRVSA